MDLDVVLDALVKQGVIGAWEYEDSNAELFIRGVAEFEGDPDVWFIVVDADGVELSGKGEI